MKRAKIKKCRTCDHTFIVSKRNAFCSDCIAAGNHLHRKDNLEDCQHDRSRKYLLLRLNGHKCSICHNTEWNGQPIPIELDHINGNHKDNRKENLRLICPNCHAQTPTYKNKNKGNGRQHRRTYIRAEGGI